MTCRLKVEASGQTLVAGLATRITVFGTASVGCSPVRVTAATAINGVPVFTDVITVIYPPLYVSNPDDPANDGSFVAEFAAPGNGLPSDTPLFVTVECIGDPQCRVLGWRSMRVKEASGQPGTSGNNTNNGNDIDWPFADPPSIVCPLWGRVFVAMLLLAMLTIVSGLSLSIPLAVAAGVLLLSGAMAWSVYWSRWCAPPRCGVLRAWVWVLKRCVIAAFGLALAQLLILPSLTACLLVPVLGVCVGRLVTELRQRRCSIPSSRASLQQLVLW